MKTHIIENGTVVNTILASVEEAQAAFPNALCVDADFGGTIGDMWDGVQFTPLTTVVEVPQVVTMRQARLALLEAGKLTDVQPAIDAMPSPQKEQAAIEWEFSSVVERNRPLVQTLGPALSLTDADLDALFIRAATL